METYLLDWANLLLRWLHVIVAIAWIGSSFYFVFLDSSLTPPEDEQLKKDGVSGELWNANTGGPAAGLVLADGRVYSAGLGGFVVAVSDTDGKRLAGAKLGAPLTDLVLSGGKLYAPGLDGAVYELEPTSLKLLRRIEMSSAGTFNDRYRPAIAATDGAVWAAFGDRLGKF